MKILITGGAGYIGSELLQYFIDDNEITVYDNLMYDSTSLLRYAGHHNFNFVKEDVRDITTLKTEPHSVEVRNWQTKKFLENMYGFIHKHGLNERAIKE